MKRITEVTRRDLFDIIQNGFDAECETLEYDAYYDREIPSFETVHVHMPFHGRFTTIDFLNRLYRLEEMPSTDKRFKNARGDIHCHTVSFDDWPEFWFLDDERFELKDGYDDEPILKFLCEMIHPAVREENSPWKDYLERFNELLNRDGYEIYSSYQISGRDIFKARKYTPAPTVFGEAMLFTHRYRGQVVIQEEPYIDLICNSVTADTQKKLVAELVHFSEPQIWQPNRYDDYQINTDAMYMALRRLNEFHAITVVQLNASGEYGNRYVSELEALFTPLLFDLIELQYHELSEAERSPFIDAINSVFERAQLDFSLSSQGTIERVLKHEVYDNSIGQNVGGITEPGLRDLLDQAIALHQQPSVDAHRDAVEKIWDAFERLKTYYIGMDKKTSAQKIVRTMSGEQTPFADLFNAEFKALTDIGNNYRIRHHETSKIDINDIRHYDYFFNRCLSLIATAIQYLN